MAPNPRFRLRSPNLLRTLMQHTGDGTRVTIRDLAEHSGCHPSHIGELLTGKQETATFQVATAIADRIGVDLLVLWAPSERTARARRPRPHLTKVAG